MTAPQSAEELAAEYAAKLAAGPAANWPYGAGTAEDPYYLPDGFVVGQDWPAR
jgi:hypothetical protein